MTAPYVHLKGTDGRPPGPPPPLSGPIHRGPPPGQSPPPPPRDTLPVDVRGGPATVLADVGRPFVTEADLAAQLTEYTVFRFEKEQNRIDDDGVPHRPKWDRCIRTEIRSITQKEIARQIRELDRVTTTAITKRNTLDPVLQRQIDRAQESLAERDPDLMSYQWVVAQIDHQLKEIPAFLRTSVTRPKKYHNSLRRRVTSSKTRHHRKPKKIYERVSLTVYFKRVPRPNVNLQMLWENKMRPRHIHPQNAHPQHAHPQHAHPVPPPGPGPQGARHPGPAPGHGPILHGERHQGPLPRHGGGGGGGGGGRKPAGMRDGDSDSASSSSRSSSDESRDTRSTANTSFASGSSARHKRPRGRNHSRPREHKRSGSKRHRDKSTYYGLHSNRRHEPHRPEHVFAGGRMPGAPFAAPPMPPPMPMPMPHFRPEADIERVKDDAYLAGRRDERIEVTDQLREEARAPRLRPRVIQAHSPLQTYRYHRIDPDELRYRPTRTFDLDDEVPRLFRNLSVDDEEYDDPLDDPRRRSHMHQGSILYDDPFARESVAYQSDESSRPRGGSHYIEVPVRAPYSPLPRRGRPYL